LEGDSEDGELEKARPEGLGGVFGVEEGIVPGASHVGEDDQERGDTAQALLRKRVSDGGFLVFRSCGGERHTSTHLTLFAEVPAFLAELATVMAAHSRISCPDARESYRERRDSLRQQYVAAALKEWKRRGGERRSLRAWGV
jgi:hypothetical protein